MYKVGKYMIALLLITTPAMGHSDGEMEYETECCHDQDCAPVTEMKPFGDQTIMTTKHGQFTVPPDFPTRPSKDSRWHLCARRTYNDSEQILCVYRPAGT